MLTLIANLLLLVAGGLSLLLVVTTRRTGPEGPVGAHMVTGPLAIGQVVAVGLGLAGGSLAAVGWHAVVVGIALPGYLVALTVLPLVGLSRRWRPLAIAGVVGAVAGCVGVVNAAPLGTAAALVGGGLVAAAGGVGYGMLLALWLQSVRNRAAVASAEVEREDTFRREQSAWQLGEWNKLPADAELWQLIQFAHALHPDVAAQCQQRIATMPELDARMDELLRTGWAEHALRYVADDYPHSRQALAPALAPFLDAECTKWEAHLRSAPMPQTWAANLFKYVECMRAVQADGGDLRAQIARWRTMLSSIRGLAPLAQRLGVA